MRKGASLCCFLVFFGTLTAATSKRAHELTPWLGDGNGACLKRCVCKDVTDVNGAVKIIVDCSSQRLLRLLFDISENHSARKKESRSVRPRFISLDYRYNLLRKIRDEFHDLPEEVTERVDEADFSFNRIQHVYENSFEPLCQLRKLSLQYNRLTSVPDLSHLTDLEILQLSYNYNIRTLTGSRLPKQLRELSLAGVGIKRICRETLLDLSMLEVLDLSMALDAGVRTRTIDRGAFGSLVHLAILNISHTRWDQSINRESLWRSLVRLRVLKARRSYLSQPVQLRSSQTGLPFSRSLSEIDYSWNQLNSENLTVANFSNLRSLHLSMTTIASLPRSAFKLMPSLTELFLSGVTSTRTNLSALCNAKRLRKLDISFNHLANLPAVSSRLEVINVKGNYLHSMQRDKFSHLRLVRRLDLSDQNISSIEKYAFHDRKHTNGTKLEILKLSNNRLREIRTDTLRGLTNLRELHVDGNLLTVLNQSLILPSLEVLLASRNQLTAVTGNFFLYMTRLRVLDLSQNRIRQLDFSSDLIELTALHLNKNSLKAIPALPTRTKLQTLNLSNNYIEGITLEDFRNCCRSLRELNLSNNTMVMPHSRVFQGLESLERLEINENNRSYTDEAFYDLKRLRRLVMRKGNLTHFPNVTFQNLTYLSLTSNALTSLETVPLGVLVPNIEYLDLSINTIEYIEPGILEGLDQLQTANFRYNNIKCPCNESSKYHASHTYIKAWLRNHTDAEANANQSQLSSLSYYCSLDEDSTELGKLFSEFNCDDKYTDFQQTLLNLASASNYSEFGVDPNMYEVGVAAHRDVCLSVLFNAMEFERKPQPQTCSRSPHFHITFLLQPNISYGYFDTGY